MSMRIDVDHYSGISRFYCDDKLVKFGVLIGKSYYTARSTIADTKVCRVKLSRGLPILVCTCSDEKCCRETAPYVYESHHVYALVPE